MDASRSLLEGLLFNPQRYDLTWRVGRYKGQQEALNLTTEEEVTVLTERGYRRDAATSCPSLPASRASRSTTSTTLATRQIRTVGELVPNQFPYRHEPYGARVSVSAMSSPGHRRDHPAVAHQHPPDRGLHQGSSSVPALSLDSWTRRTPDRSDLKRRLSALGPGGLAGRIASAAAPTCRGRPRASQLALQPHVPDRDPEGPNIGLIGSLALYARVNEYGFIEAPFRRVENGVATDQIDWMTADEEEKHVIAPANTPLDPKTNEFITTDAEGARSSVRTP